MPSGKKITHREARRVLQLLRQIKRPGSLVKRADIARIVRLDRHTVREVIEQAAVHWLEDIEQAERLSDMIDRGT